MELTVEKNSKFEALVALIIIMLPFQQILTLQVGLTIRISDLIIGIAFILMFLTYLKKGQKLYFNIFFLYLLFNTMLMTVLLNDQIKYGISTFDSSVTTRTLINIFGVIIAIMAYSIGVFIGKKDYIFIKIIKLWSKMIIFLSFYVFIQFLVINITGTWIHLPGEHLNEITSYAYGLRRSYGFSIEPGALGNLLVFSFLLIFTYLEKSRLKNITLVFCLVAIFCSMSSIAIITIVSFVFLGMLSKKMPMKYKILLITLLTFTILLIFNNKFLYTATVGKVFEDNYSKLDRTTNSVILKNMFIDHPIFGVGFGNYGALRNLYSANTEFPYRNFYDMPNSFYFELMGELGIVGTIFFLIFAIKLFIYVKKSKKNPILIILPFLLLITPSSNITANYLAIGLGIIYGRYLYLRRD
ncbi:O-antigen ligase family protein [Heyndrickxia coagulans]|uniref:O-antigen ligase family protein n=1 Tax=Heyndrickxia coagulans TaxID=1398 RepID=UPI002E234561|nr:O-antigen ligase family protein [Heyndrickxia coagulans]